jgi:hypothetical protein
VIQKELLSDIDTFLARVEHDLGLRITTVTHKKNGDLEFFINGGGSILVSGERDFQITFENLGAVLASKEFKHLKPGNFRYIDVRFENKIFVNEELILSTTTATSTLSASSTTNKLPE